jgi:hypothetical protein
MAGDFFGLDFLALALAGAGAGFAVCFALDFADMGWVNIASSSLPSRVSRATSFLAI